jgi:DNA-binding CsgD family transcriptional regulator
MTLFVKHPCTATLCADLKKICDEEHFKSYAVLKFPDAGTANFSDMLIGTDWSKDAILQICKESVFQTKLLDLVKFSTLPMEIELETRLETCNDSVFIMSNLGNRLSAFCIYDPDDSKYLSLFTSSPHQYHNSNSVLMKCLAAINSYFRQSVASRQRSPLSQREIECLRWAAAGKTSEETAIILSLSGSTINTYLKSAMRKLNAYNRVQAVVQAYKQKVL